MNASGLSPGPSWLRDAVVYGVTPLFTKWGYRSIDRRLPYLRRLGVNTLWFSPLTPSPIGDFG